MTEQPEPSREVIQIVNSVDKNLRLYVHRGLAVLFSHEELQGRDDEVLYFIGEALVHIETVERLFRNARLELGLEEQEDG